MPSPPVLQGKAGQVDVPRIKALGPKHLHDLVQALLLLHIQPIALGLLSLPIVHHLDFDFLSEACCRAGFRVRATPICASGSFEVR